MLQEVEVLGILLLLTMLEKYVSVGKLVNQFVLILMVGLVMRLLTIFLILVQ